MPHPPNQPDLDASRLASEIAAATADPSRRIGRYVVLSELGRGGMGVVYRCWDPSLLRLVALKLILDPDHAGPVQLKRFQREGRVMAKLSHPGIVQLLDVGDHNGQPFIALEFVDGRTFEDAYRHHRPSAPELANVLAQVADALHYAHEQGVVHRDVKPGNVLIEPSGRARLTDFGLVAVSDATTRLTRTGRAVGTPGYMAPEQLSNDLGEAGPHSDIYGLGGLLFWGLTGEDPFKGDSVVEILRQVLMSDVRPPRELEPDTHPDLNRITLRCLSKRPEHRQATAADLAKDLRRVARGEKLEERAKQRKTSRLTVATAGLALLASAVGLGVWLFRTEDTPPKPDSRAVSSEPNPGPQAKQGATTALHESAPDHVPVPTGEKPTAASAAALIRQGLEKLSPKGSDLQRRDIPGAIADFSHAIELEPQLATAWLARGKAHSTNGNSRAALADFSHVIEIEPALVEAWLVRGKTRANLRRPLEAIADFSRAIELDPTNLDAWDSRARQRLKTGDVEGAEEDFQHYRSLYQHARETFRDSPAGHVLRGDSLQLQMKYAKAVAEYEKALALDPSYALDETHASAWAFLGKQQLDLGDIHGASATLTRAVEIAPDHEDAWAILGNLCLGMGNVDRAIFSHSRAIEIDPTDAVNWANRGKARMARRDYARAMEDFSKSVALDTNNAGVWYDRGQVHYATGNPARAIDDFSRSLALDATAATVWSSRGLAHGMLGDHASAIDDLSRSLALDATAATVWSSRGLAHGMLGDHASAIDDLSRALALEPGSAITWYNRGAARTTTDDFEGAIDDFNNAIRLDPRDPDFWIGRGGARKATGDLDGAISDFEQCLEQAPRHPAAPDVRSELEQARLERSKANGGPGN